MRAYAAFVKKEWLESVRGFRLLVLGLISVLLAVISPLSARYLPEIVGQLLTEGVKIELAEPVAADAWLQFFKNFSQIGMTVFVIMYSGIMANEYAKGTLVCILTKGMPRRSVILAKFTSMILCWSGCFLAAAGICGGYTWYFWGRDAFVIGLPAHLAGMWLVGVLFLTAALLGGVVFSNAYGSVLSAGGLAVIQIAAGMFPGAADYMPLSMIPGSAAHLQEAAIHWEPAAVAFVFCLVAASFLFDKRKLLLL